MLFNAKTAAAAVLAATSVAASPVQSDAKTVKLPLTQHVNVKSASGLAEKGLARIHALNYGTSKESTLVASGPATNDDVSYIAPVTIGSTTYSLIADTGSSNTWCGAQSRCEPSSTGTSTGNSVSVSYGSGSFSGTEYFDRVTYAGLTVNRQSIGSASTSQGFQGVDGILGLGPVGLTSGTVANTGTVPTFLDNLYKQGSISTEVLGVYFAPVPGSATSANNGELTLGGTDPNKYSGSITYFPKLASGTASAYWGISIAAVRYGSTTLQSSFTGIVDTGTTLIYIPTTAYNNFLSAAGGYTDSNTGFATFNTKPTQNFSFQFGSTTFSLTPDQYLVPQAQYANFGFPSGKYYAWIYNGGTGAVSTIIGQKFLEQYYSVYDTTNSRIGFAPRR